MKRTIIVFGSISAVMLLLFQLEKWSLFSLGPSENLSLFFYGVFFLIVGIVFNRFIFLKIENRKRESLQQILSERELDVLDLMARGHSNKEIAEELFIAETTVKSHVSNILDKLDAKRRTEAIRIGRELDLV